MQYMRKVTKQEKSLSNENQEKLTVVRRILSLVKFDASSGQSGYQSSSNSQFHHNRLPKLSILKPLQSCNQNAAIDTLNCFNTFNRDVTSFVPPSQPTTAPPLFTNSGRVVMRPT